MSKQCETCKNKYRNKNICGATLKVIDIKRYPPYLNSLLNHNNYIFDYKSCVEVNKDNNCKLYKRRIKDTYSDLITSMLISTIPFIIISGILNWYVDISYIHIAVMFMLYPLVVHYIDKYCVKNLNIESEYIIKLEQRVVNNFILNKINKYTVKDEDNDNER